MTVPWIDLVGFWIGIFLTFAILSYLYKDNPFYKMAEHLFVGVSIGYVITQQYYNVIHPNLLDHLARDHWYEMLIPNVYWIPLVLVALLFVRSASRRLGWLGRYPLAFVVALYAGVQVNALAESDLAQQITVSTRSLAVPKVDVNTADVPDMATLPGFSPPVAAKVVKARAHGLKLRSLDDLQTVPDLTPAQKQDLADARGAVVGLDAQASVTAGEHYWFGIASRVLLLVGLCASLIYFYFSLPQKGVVGRIARFGVYILMIGFGASFGYTVQGRLALAVGRATDVLGLDKAPALAQQIHGPVVSVVSIVVIIVGIVVWERRWLPRHGGDGEPPLGPPLEPPDDDLPAY